MATSSGYDPYWDTVAPTSRGVYRTQTLGDLVVTRSYDRLRLAITFRFDHTALDLHVEHIVSECALSGRICGVDIVSEIGPSVERQMLQMLRDKINPPKPKPVPPMYAVFNSREGSDGSYLRANFGWGRIDDAVTYSTPAEAARHLQAAAVRIGRPFLFDTQIVRVDVLTQTLEKRVVTVLK